MLKVQELNAKLKQVFEGNPWFGDALIVKLNTIDFTLVNQKLPNSKNSIAIIVQHLINWRAFVIKKLEGDEVFDIEMNSEDDWTNVVVENLAQWEALLDELVRTQTTITSILDTENNPLFLEQMVLGRTYNFDYLLEGLIQHDIYHFGQIGFLYAYLKREAE